MATKRSPLAKDMLRKTRTLCATSLKMGDVAPLGELAALLEEVLRILQSAMKKGSAPSATKARPTPNKAARSLRAD